MSSLRVDFSPLRTSAGSRRETDAPRQVFKPRVGAQRSKLWPHIKQVSPALPVPNSPSYPSEHAAAAGAAAAVLSYLFPGDAQTFAGQAQECGESRLNAGVQFPSDVSAGMELGRRVAEIVIARAQTDGSDAVFTGEIPTGPGFWRGTNPLEPLAGTWRTWVISSGSEFRPPPPPAFDSAQKAQELAEVKNFPRPIPAGGASFTTTRAAYFWQTPPYFEAVE